MAPIHRKQLMKSPPLADVWWQILSHQHISTLHACKLDPLKRKDNGIRPVVVREYRLRIFGKAMTILLQEGIIRAAGTLQTCVGLESGIEAAIHSIRKSFQDKNDECLPFANTENAFSKLNRKVSLKHQMTMSAHIHLLTQHYNAHSTLYLENGAHILS